MRKPRISVMLVITCLFAVFTLGFFLGRMQNRSEIVVSVPEEFRVVPSDVPDLIVPETEETITIAFPISINQAGKEALMALPGIGEVLAERILAYREENGNFSAVEDLLQVEGIGKKRLEGIMDLIIIGG